VIAAYRESREQSGREPAEIRIQAVFSLADSDEAALEQAREWKGTLVDEHYTDPIADPAEIYRRGEEGVGDGVFTKQIIAAADPKSHVRRIKLLPQLGATVMVLMNVSGGDPHHALRVYGAEVLPELRD
jgi:alkanesulfonate monooxygenase SsuD/methylene tetrahydromethanopterin reductase-like flavin-dependent oxidoreductase (luciferase family)